MKSAASRCPNWKVSSRLFQRSLAAITGLLLAGFLIFLLLALTQYRPMANALRETDRTWAALHDAARLRAKTAQSLVTLTLSSSSAIIERRQAASALRSASEAIAQTNLNPRISPFDPRSTIAFARANLQIEKASETFAASIGSDATTLLDDNRKVRTAIHAFNVSVHSYNAETGKFPRNLVADTFGFFQKPTVQE